MQGEGRALRGADAEGGRAAVRGYRDAPHQRDTRLKSQPPERFFPLLERDSRKNKNEALCK